jgi:hypothetical protein
MAIRGIGLVVTCASCSAFPLAEALAAGGHAICPKYRMCRGYDWPATVLHMPAHDMGDRRRMVQAFEESQREKEEHAKQQTR